MAYNLDSMKDVKTQVRMTWDKKPAIDKACNKLINKKKILNWFI